MQKIGFIGLGLMGQPMVARLLAAGYAVTVWNRTAASTILAAQAGAAVADSVAELVSGSDIVMLCVTDTDAVRAVVFGPEGVVHYGGQHQVLVDFSSILPSATREMAARLQQYCGMQWIDAPVSGGVAGALAGSLAIMAGGDPEVLDGLRPVLAHLGQRVTHMGPVGAGQATKIGNQMLVSCNIVVMAEMMALLEQAGVDSNQLAPALAGGFADSLPLQITGPRMAAREFEQPRWTVNTLLKDLTMAAELAAELGGEIPASRCALEQMRAFVAGGGGALDPAALITRYAAQR